MGFMTNLNLAKGTYASQGKPVMALIDSDSYRVTCATCSRGPWVARQATSSRCRSAASIIGWCTG